ncbi:MAG: flagellar export chaperone FliS [Desulfovibrio sp.]
MNKAAKAYFATQVTTTTQGELLLMLYDAAIKFLKQAKVKMAEKDYAKKGILISKALDVIAELTASLNKEKGGEIAQNLSQLYFFCSTHLAKANLKMDPTMIDDVIGILTSIQSAFAQIIPEHEGRAPRIPAQQTGSASNVIPKQAATPGTTASAAPKPKAAPSPQLVKPLQRPAAPAANQPQAVSAASMFPTQPQVQPMATGAQPAAPRPVQPAMQQAPATARPSSAPTPAGASTQGISPVKPMTAPTPGTARKKAVSNAYSRQ